MASRRLLRSQIGKIRRGFKVYTRTGDEGKTSLYNGLRASKTTPTFEALGNTDELNSLIGVARYKCSQIEGLKELEHMISDIQSRLLDVGSHIATPKLSSPDDRIKAMQFDEKHVVQLENWIDQMDEELPELKNFILPGGGDVGSALHVARSVARRTERSVIPIVMQEEADHSVLKYLNRLSDFFFVAARYASAKTGEDEVVYKKERE